MTQIKSHRIENKCVRCPTMTVPTETHTPERRMTKNNYDNDDQNIVIVCFSIKSMRIENQLFGFYWSSFCMSRALALFMAIYGNACRSFSLSPLDTFTEFVVLFFLLVQCPQWGFATLKKRQHNVIWQRKLWRHSSPRSM